MLMAKQVFHIRICQWHELSGTTVATSKFIGKTHALSRDLMELSWKKSHVLWNSTNMEPQSLSLWTILGTQTMTPWYGTTSILLAAQLNKKFPGDAFMSNNANVVEKHRNVNFATCCIVLMAEINFITWGALSSLAWDKSTIRCHARSYWPCDIPVALSLQISCSKMWDTMGVSDAIFLLWNAKRSGHRVMTFFGRFGG